VAGFIQGSSVVAASKAPPYQQSVEFVNVTLITLDSVYNAAVTTLSQPAEAPSARGRRVRRTRGDERERAILETAERLLEERPLHEVSVDDLARGAGISRPTFYFYFPSKEAVLLTLLDRIVDEARDRMGEAVERFAEDPPRWLRAGITAIYDTFSAHRAVTVASADALATSPEARELWARVMEGFVQVTTATIEAERARGAAPDGVPARDLAIALNRMNERVLLSTFAGQPPAVDEANVLDVLVAAWLGAVYGGPA
jgi:TetR/AcrR family transcriptional regulator, ethionamide resistance regulator